MKMYRKITCGACGGSGIKSCGGWSNTLSPTREKCELCNGHGYYLEEYEVPDDVKIVSGPQYTKIV